MPAVQQEGAMRGEMVDLDGVVRVEVWDSTDADAPIRIKPQLRKCSGSLPKTHVSRICFLLLRWLLMRLIACCRYDLGDGETAIGLSAVFPHGWLAR